MADKIATREGYGKALVEFGETNKDFLVLDADLADATKTVYFKKAFPERFFDTGIAEGNMMSVAAGLASCGKTVFASSFAMFAAGRAFEQIRNSICYPKLNVKIAATHAGLSVGEDGATHQCLEDVGLMRTLPGMVVMTPSDAVQARWMIKAALEYQGPMYFRFARLATPVFYDENTDFEIGKGVVLKDGTDVTIIACGLMVEQAMEAAEILNQQGIYARVIDMHTIKPIDRDLVLKAAKETGAIVTVEEHSVYGGLGSAVAEVVTDEYPVPVKIMGTEKFGTSGKPAELFELYGLTAKHIAEKAKDAIKLKK